MANGNWLFLHRSEEYIFYYRRAIPNSIRYAFGNRWEIKKSLKTRERSIAILRHNELNAKVERIFMDLKMGGVMAKDLSSMLGELEVAKKAVADFEVGKVALFSGICALLRGIPLTDVEGKVIRPLNLSIVDGKITMPDGEVVHPSDIAVALKLADRDKAIPLSPKLERELNTFERGEGTSFWFDFERGHFVCLDKPKGKPQTTPSPDHKVIETQPETSEPQSDSKFIPIRFSEMAEKFLAYRTNLKPKTKEDFRGIVRVFIDLQGDLMSTELSHPVFSAFRDKVKHLPSNSTKRYPNKKPHELLEMDIPESELMSPSNINKYVGRISQICEWGTNEGFMELNFASNKRMK